MEWHHRCARCQPLARNFPTKLFFPLTRRDSTFPTRHRLTAGAQTLKVEKISITKFPRIQYIFPCQQSLPTPSIILKHLHRHRPVALVTDHIHRPQIGKRHRDIVPLLLVTGKDQDRNAFCWIFRCYLTSSPIRIIRLHPHLFLASSLALVIRSSRPPSLRNACSRDFNCLSSR